MSLDIVAATSALAFISSWNELLFGLMPATIRATPLSGGGMRWGVAAAVMILATLPPLLPGLFTYRLIGRSMTADVVKG